MAEYDVVLISSSLINLPPKVKKQRISNVISPLSMSRAHAAGLSSISGIVTIQGRPVSRPIMVLSQSGELIAKTTSNDSGAYSVAGLDSSQRYIVLSLDTPDREYNAAISDYVKPE